MSVLIITYNHASYIETALRSVLAQRTSRTVEIIVSEDRSTDGTHDIVRRWADETGKIRIIRSERNLASNAVVSRAIASARGRYVCLLDGDDFWTDENKIERQAEILDRDPELSAVFHNAAVVDADGRQTAARWTAPEQAAVTDLAELWKGNPFATCAGMLRREALDGLGPWYDDFFPITDWPLYILCAQRAPVAFVDETVGAYRLHDTGLFSSLAKARKLDQVASFYSRMRRICPREERGLARDGETLFFLEWARAYAQGGDRRLAVDCLRRALAAGGIGSTVSLRRFLRIAAHAFAANPGAGRPA